MRHVATKDKPGLYGLLEVARFRDGRLVGVEGPYRNKVVSGSGGYGRNLVMRRLMGDATYGIEIDSAQLGDDDTAAADSDTGPGNLLLDDIPITSKSTANAVGTVKVFLSDGNLPDDTYKEMVFRIDGRTFSRVVFGPYTKAAGEDTLFTYTLTATG